MPDRDKFLDEACSGIRDRRTRDGVREELSSHIDDKAEDYVLFGCSPTEAEEKAVADMGDAKKLSVQLAEIHSFFPLKKFRNSLVLFAIGFILVSIQLNVGIFDEICTFVGNLAMLIACFNLMSSNKLLYCAFIFSFASYFVMTAGWVISSLPYAWERDVLTICVMVVGVLISLIRMYVFGYGIAKFSQGKASKRAKRVGWIYLAAYAIFGITYAVPDLIWLTFAVFIVMVIVIVRAILGVSGDVWRNDRDVVVAKHTLRAVAILCAFMVTLAAVAPCVRIAFNCQSAKTQQFVVNDLSGEEAERAEEARQLVAGQFYDIEFVDELIGEVSDKIAQSHLLRLCGDDVIVQKGEMRSALGWQCVNLFFYHFEGQEAERVTVLSMYRYIDGAQFSGVCQTAYSANGLTIKNSKSMPVIFVDLCTVDGRTVRVENNYEYISTARIGVENSFVKDSHGRSGYILFDIALGGADSFIFTEQRYVNSRIFRQPYNRQIIDYGQTDESGWRKLNAYSNGIKVPQSH